MTPYPQRLSEAARWGGLLLGLPLTLCAQAPPTPERPWPIPEQAFERAAGFGAHEPPIATEKAYDLPGLIDLAQRMSPETRGAWETAKAAAAEIGLAEAAYLPQLTFQAIGGFEHTPLPAPKDVVPKGYFVSNTRQVIPALSVKWLLFDFGRRKAALEGAQADSFVANVAFTGAHQSLVYAVSRAYFDLSGARGRLRAAKQALETAKTTEEAATAKRTAGLATVVAVAQAKRQTAQAAYSLAAAEGAERTAWANLIASLGVPAGTLLQVLDVSEMPVPDSPQQTLSAAVNQALSHRPDIIAALGKIDAAEANLKGEKSSYWPQIALSGSAFQNFGSVSSDGKPYSTIDRTGGTALLSFSVPVFDGGIRRNRVSIAQSKVREAEEELAKTRDGVSQQVVKSYDSLISSLAEYQAAMAYGVAAHTAYDAASRSYKAGVGTYTDLATEENAVAQADTQIEDARANAHTAAAALAFAMGATTGAGSD